MKILAVVFFLLSSTLSYGQSNFQIVQTDNIYTALKLDTRTGEIDQIYDDGEKNFSSQITPSLTNSFNKENNSDNIRAYEYLQADVSTGRFELYETENFHNFLLLDSFSGRVWQVQFSLKNNEGYWPINEKYIGTYFKKTYKLERTSNIWTFYLSNDSTGELYKVYFSLKGDQYRGITKIN